MELQNLRIIVLAIASDLRRQFISSLYKTPYVAVSRNPDYYTSKTTITLDFGEWFVSPKLRVFMFGADDWEIFFRREELKEFVEGINGFVVIVNANDVSSLAAYRPMLDMVRRYEPIPHTLVCANLHQPDSISIEQLRDMLNLPSDQIVLSCDVIDSSTAQSTILSTLIRLPDRSSIQRISHLVIGD